VAHRTGRPGCRVRTPRGGSGGQCVGHRVWWRRACDGRGRPGPWWQETPVGETTPPGVAAASGSRSSRQRRREGARDPHDRRPHGRPPRLRRDGPRARGPGRPRGRAWGPQTTPPCGGGGWPCSPPPLGARPVAGPARAGGPSGGAGVGAAVRTTRPHHRPGAPRGGAGGAAGTTAPSRWERRRGRLRSARVARAPSASGAPAPAGHWAPASSDACPAHPPPRGDGTTPPSGGGPTGVTRTAAARAPTRRPTSAPTARRDRGGASGPQRAAVPGQPQGGPGAR
jgi:hypothetical protein